MKSLIVEDDFAARRLMQIYLAKLGKSDIATNGINAVEVFREALENDDPYDLICLDIMMPQMDGMEALVCIRRIEKEFGIEVEDGAKIIITTAKRIPSHITKALKMGCESYLIKPIRKKDLIEEIEKLGLTSSKW